MLPAPAQGAIGVETRSDDRRLRALVAKIDDETTHTCVIAERRVLAGLNGDCRSPIAALAERQEDGSILLRAEILTPDGREVERGEAAFAPDDEEAPGALAREMLGRASPRLRALFAI
jgi:hydroxymethylbilane synthase